MNCILKSCAQAGYGRCELLGECGAAYALEQARERTGYRVLITNNLIIRALLKEHFIWIDKLIGIDKRKDHSIAVVYAKERAAV